MASAALHQERIEIGRVLARTFSGPGANFATLAAVALALVGVPSFAQELVNGDAALNPFAAYSSPARGALTLVSVVGTALFQAIVIRCCLASLHGRFERTGEAIGAILPRIVPVVAVSILYWILVMAGAILLLVPGIIALVALYVAPAALVNEEIGAVDAISRSWDLTRGLRWRILWLIILIGLLYGLSAFLIGVAVGVGGGDVSASVPAVAVQAALLSIVQLFASSTVAALYLELVTVREGGANDQLAAVFE